MSNFEMNVSMKRELDNETVTEHNKTRRQIWNITRSYFSGNGNRSRVRKQ